MATPANGSDDYCSKCGHARRDHTDEVIPRGQYGEGGRCGWWRDPMFGPTQECHCSGFVTREATKPK